MSSPSSPLIKCGASDTVKKSPHVGVAGNGYLCGKTTCSKILEELYGYKYGSYALALKQEVLHLLNYGFVDKHTYIEDLLRNYATDLNQAARFLALHQMARVTEFTLRDIENPNLKNRLFREILQWWGTDVRRKHYYSSYWVSQMDWSYSRVVGDVRFPDEVEKIQKLKGKVIYLVNPSLETTDAHASEQLDRNICDTIVVWDPKNSNICYNSFCTVAKITGNKVPTFEEFNAALEKSIK